MSCVGRGKKRMPLTERISLKYKAADVSNYTIPDTITMLHRRITKQVFVIYKDKGPGWITEDGDIINSLTENGKKQIKYYIGKTSTSNDNPFDYAIARNNMSKKAKEYDNIAVLVTVKKGDSITTSSTYKYDKGSKVDQCILKLENDLIEEVRFDKRFEDKNLGGVGRKSSQSVGVLFLAYNLEDKNPSETSSDIKYWKPTFCGTCTSMEQVPQDYICQCNRRHEAKHMPDDKVANLTKSMSEIGIKDIKKEDQGNHREGADNVEGATGGI